MKCCKCKYDNRVKANYCYKCGYEFTEEEKNIAFNETRIGQLENVEDKISNLDIRNHKWYKILSIIVTLGIGLFYLLTYGFKFKILESPNYKIQYNKKDKEYYIITEQEEVAVNLYTPGSDGEVKITLYNDSKEALSSNKVSKNKEVILTDNGPKDYYILENKGKELKVIVVGGIYE